MTLLAPRREVGEFRQRYKWMALVALTVFAVLTGRAIQLQVFEHERYAEAARENITRTISYPATRGIVHDTHGHVIATNRPSYDVYLTPQMVRDVSRVGELMNLSEEQLTGLSEKMDAVPPHRRGHQIKMLSGIDRDQLAALETHAGDLPGVDVVGVPLRAYPQARLGSHFVGYLNEVSAEDLARLEGQGYGAGDLIGRTGIESAWESYLRGRSGFQQVSVDARGQRLDTTVLGGEVRREPVPGRDVVLAIDTQLMRVVERAFRGHPSGAAVVLDVRSGRVRALFSKPSYDPNEMSGRLSAERYTELVDNPFRPLIDKTIYESYFPGSTFKAITALAALSAGIDPADRVDCPGFYEIGNRRFRCSHAHGDVDMRRAIVQSCNVYFWKLAEQVGLDKIGEQARDFGLGAPTGIGINAEAEGLVPSKEWYRERDIQFRIGYTLNTAIGQGNTKVTLLQLAVVYAAIANGGTLYVPQLVERVTEPSGTLIEEFEPRVRRRVAVDREDLTYVIDGLYGVVNDPSGTAYDARVDDGVPVAGKTGTAEVARRHARPGEDPSRSWYFNRDHAWFAGFAPAGDPEVAIVVLVEHGGGGGKYAAPVAMQILQEYLGGQGSRRPVLASVRGAGQ